MKNISALGGHRGAAPARVIAARRSLWLCVTLIALALQGCANITSAVKTIERTSPSTTDADNSFIPGELVQLDGLRNAPITFQVSGDGVCNRMFINFGDGTQPVEFTNVDLTTKPTFTHTYAGWNGQKTVWAYGNWSDGCGGNARMQVRIGAVWFRVGYVPSSQACSSIPGMPPVRKNSIVKFTNLDILDGTDGATNVIDFGCIGGCSNGPMGVRDTVAGPDYPFPGLRERSLVIRVGTQAVQGDQFSPNFSFTATETGPLEFCVNDFPLTDNTGSWGIGLSVDESAAE